MCCPPASIRATPSARSSSSSGACVSRPSSLSALIPRLPFLRSRQPAIPAQRRDRKRHDPDVVGQHRVHEHGGRARHAAAHVGHREDVRPVDVVRRAPVYIAVYIATAVRLYVRWGRDGVLVHGFHWACFCVLRSICHEVRLARRRRRRLRLRLRAVFLSCLLSACLLISAWVGMGTPFFSNAVGLPVARLDRRGQKLFIASDAEVGCKHQCMCIHPPSSGTLRESYDKIMACRVNPAQTHAHD